MALHSLLPARVRPRHRRRVRRTPRATALVSAAVVLSATLVAVAGGSDAATSTLPGNATISVTVGTPSNGATVPYGDAVPVSGTASISDVGGTGTPPPADTVLATVVDISGSTGDPAGTSACGDQNGVNGANEIVDCEIKAAISLNEQARSVGTIADVGIVGFSSIGQPADVWPVGGAQLITTPVADRNGNSVRDVDEVFRSMRGSSASIGLFTPYSTGGSTDFADALVATRTVLNASTMPKRIVAFLSDGVSTEGANINAALSNLPPNTTIYTFAVGSGSSCTRNEGGRGSLQDIAVGRGGFCTVVTDPANLPNVLPTILKPKLNSLSLTVDGGTAVPVTSTPALPATGPASVSYSKSVTGLLPGHHDLCVTASGSDAGGPGSATECVQITVEKAPSTISTDASGSVTVGTGTLSDSAAVSSALTATGTVIFRLYGPGDPTCSASPVFLGHGDLAATVGGDQVALSDGFAPTVAGTYHWVASYPGDSDNAGASGSCGDPDESVVVTKADASIVTDAAKSVVVGDAPITDKAEVTGYHPTGTVRFDLYGPDDAACTREIVFSSTVGLDNGTATSAAFTPTAAGTYRWIASYSGDADNEPASGACNDVGEASTVDRASPAIHTTASDDTTVGDGGTLADTVHVTGGYGPTGTVTFRLYGPGDASCSGTPVSTSTVALAGDSAISASYSPTAAGTYRWVASYGGDANNKAASGSCDDPDEATTVARAKPAITTSATEFAAFGAAAISDRATVSGGYSPTGTVTFRAYGPDDTTCAGSPVFVDTAPLVGGSATSAAFNAPVPGVYQWVAVYGGDGNNVTASGACGDAAEKSVVGKMKPALTTTASPNVPMGGKVHDTAKVTGPFAPTGSVTFALFGPADPTCSGVPVFTTTAPLSGGSATSAPYTTTATGTYHWVATYNGDERNQSVAGTCGDAGESVTVTPQVLTGRASAVDVNASVLGLPLIPVHLQNTGPVATTSSATYGSNTCIDANLGIVTATLLCSRVVTQAGYPARSTATSTIASATVAVSVLPVITVKAVQASSATTCQGSTGATTIAYLKVGGTVVIASPTQVAPNTVVLVGAVRLVLNEQTPFVTPDAGLTVNAVHATVDALVAKADVVIGSAESDIGNCPTAG